MLTVQRRVHKLISGGGPVEIVSCSLVIEGHGSGIESDAWRRDAVRVIDGVPQFEWTTTVDRARADFSFWRGVWQRVSEQKSCDDVIAALRAMKWRAPRRTGKPRLDDELWIDVKGVLSREELEGRWGGMQRLASYEGVDAQTELVAGFAKGDKEPTRWMLREKSSQP